MLPPLWKICRCDVISWFITSICHLGNVLCSYHTLKIVHVPLDDLQHLFFGLVVPLVEIFDIFEVWISLENTIVALVCIFHILRCSETVFRKLQNLFVLKSLCVYFRIILLRPVVKKELLRCMCRQLFCRYILAPIKLRSPKEVKFWLYFSSPKTLLKIASTFFV